MEILASTVRERAGLALLAGVGVLVAAVILFIVSSLLGPMTPIMAVAVAVSLLLILLLGYTGLSFWLGRILARGSRPLVAVLLGAILIAVLQVIPLVLPVFFLLALGSVVLSGCGSASDWLVRRR